MKIALVDDTPIIVEPPDAVELTLKKTDPGLRGDTASGGSKLATLQAGLQIQVSLFIQEGDVIKPDLT